MLSRKHYKVIASIIKDNTSQIENNNTLIIDRDSFINDITMYFKSDNNRFSWERFVNACDE